MAGDLCGAFNAAAALVKYSERRLQPPEAPSAPPPPACCLTAPTSTVPPPSRTAGESLPLRHRSQDSAALRTLISVKTWDGMAFHSSTGDIFAVRRRPGSSVYGMAAWITTSPTRRCDGTGPQIDQLIRTPGSGPQKRNPNRATSLRPAPLRGRDTQLYKHGSQNRTMKACPKRLPIRR